VAAPPPAPVPLGLETATETWDTIPLEESAHKPGTSVIPPQIVTPDSLGLRVGCDGPTVESEQNEAIPSSDPVVEEAVGESGSTHDAQAENGMEWQAAVSRGSGYPTHDPTPKTPDIPDDDVLPPVDVVVSEWVMGWLPVLVSLLN
jgi:hypothetical protein